MDGPLVSRLLQFDRINFSDEALVIVGELATWTCLGIGADLLRLWFNCENQSSVRLHPQLAPTANKTKGGTPLRGLNKLQTHVDLMRCIILARLSLN